MPRFIEFEVIFAIITTFFTQLSIIVETAVSVKSYISLNTDFSGKGQEDPGLKDQTQKDPDPKDHGPKDPQN